MTVPVRLGLFGVALLCDLPAMLLDTERAELFSIKGFSITAFVVRAFLHELQEGSSA